MKRPNYVARVSGKTLHFITALVPLILASWTLTGHAQSVTNLYSFVGTSSDGGVPSTPLIQAADGNLYGAALGRVGKLNTNNYGCVFRISSNGNFTNLYSFKSSDGGPASGLVQGSDGNFYATIGGGNTNLDHGSGFGAIIRMGHFRPEGWCRVTTVISTG